MRILLFTCLVVVSLFSCKKHKTNSVQQKTVKKTVLVKPTMNLVALGDVPNFDIQFVKKELEVFYNVNIIIQKELIIGDELKVTGMNRYRADSILSFLDKKFRKTNGKVLAITTKDICIDRELNGVVYKNWGIFGLGSLSGKNCVVSTARFGNKHFDRLSKVSIHEVGHTLGIPHCDSDVNCLMNDAKGKGGKVDSEKKWMCKQCKLKIIW